MLSVMKYGVTLVAFSLRKELSLRAIITKHLNIVNEEPLIKHLHMYTLNISIANYSRYFTLLPYASSAR